MPLDALVEGVKMHPFMTGVLSERSLFLYEIEYAPKTLKYNLQNKVDHLDILFPLINLIQNGICNPNDVNADVPRHLMHFGSIDLYNGISISE